MDFDLEYAEACHPDIFRMLGKEIPVFRVGHQLLLKRIKSPFICGGNITPADIISAVQICSQSYKDAAKSLYSGNCLSLRLWTWKWSLLLSNQNAFQAHKDALDEMIEQAHKAPRGFFKPQRGGSVTVTPFTLLFASDLAERFNISESEFMEWPMRKAVFWRFKILETEGGKGWGWSRMYTPPEERTHAE